MILFYCIAISGRDKTGATTFEVTRSDNGTVFTTLSSVPGKGIPSHYTFYDPSPLKGTNYYRLKIIAENDVVSYSDVAIVRNGRAGGTITLSPVPAKDKVILTNYVPEYIR